MTTTASNLLVKGFMEFSNPVIIQSSVSEPDHSSLPFLSTSPPLSSPVLEQLVTLPSESPSPPKSVSSDTLGTGMASSLVATPSSPLIPTLPIFSIKKRTKAAKAFSIDGSSTHGLSVPLSPDGNSRSHSVPGIPSSGSPILRAALASQRKPSLTPLSCPDSPSKKRKKSKETMSSLLTPSLPLASLQSCGTKAFLELFLDKQQRLNFQLINNASGLSPSNKRVILDRFIPALSFFGCFEQLLTVFVDSRKADGERLFSPSSVEYTLLASYTVVSNRSFWTFMNSFLKKTLSQSSSPKPRSGKLSPKDFDPNINSLLYDFLSGLAELSALLSEETRNVFKWLSKRLGSQVKPSKLIAKMFLDVAFNQLSFQLDVSESRKLIILREALQVLVDECFSPHKHTKSSIYEAARSLCSDEYKLLFANFIKSFSDSAGCSVKAKIDESEAALSLKFVRDLLHGQIDSIWCALCADPFTLGHMTSLIILGIEITGT